VQEFDFTSMNETDVREVVIRPFIESLGYRHGTANNIRTEAILRYPYRFLGKKKPASDPKLLGRADYICEVVSYGRWIVEVKSPSRQLSLEDVEQAHSYAAHPEIGAAHFLLTNGREFRVYVTGDLESPLLHWSYSEIVSRAVEITNMLGPEAVKLRGKANILLRSKALALGLGSEVEVTGGVLEYETYDCENSAQQAALASFAGLRATVSGGDAGRDDEGMIRARFKLLGPTKVWDEMNRAAGIEYYEFKCSDDYVSTDVQKPSIFQGTTSIAAGTSISGLPGLPPGLNFLPFELRCNAFSQATGYLSGKRFLGTFVIIYVTELPPEVMRIAGITKDSEMISCGTFEFALR
jgi:hypothetical protein